MLTKIDYLIFPNGFNMRLTAFLDSMLKLVKGKFFLAFSSTIIFFNFTFSQSQIDTQEFIEEQVHSNSPLPNYESLIYFKGNISQFDAEVFAGRSLTSEEFEHLFIYSRIVYRDGRSGWQWTRAEVIDIRDIKKVSITKEEDGGRSYYTINVYLGGNYPSKKYILMKVNSPEWEGLDRMRITIGNNPVAAQKIKKAIMHFGVLEGITIKDGDLF